MEIDNSNSSASRRPGAGRKAIPIDLIELEKLCFLHCTDEEIADFLSVSVRTLVNRRKDPAFAEVMRRGRGKGRISVRRAQWKLMDAGNAQMSIWLGKQVLGQRDVTPVELSGPQGQPLVSLEAFDLMLARARKSRTDSGGKSSHRAAEVTDENPNQ